MTADRADNSSSRGFIRVCLVLSCVVASWAHVNSPHIYLEESAGPYRVIVVVHMPPAVPGEAELQVRVQNRDPGEKIEVWVREIPPDGEEYAPEWHMAAPSTIDPDFFTAPIPLMVFGLWHAGIRVNGPRGEGSIEIPIPARIAGLRRMETGRAALLVLLSIVLLASAWQILTGLRRDALRGAEEATGADVRAGHRWAIVGVTSMLIWLGFIGFSWHLADARHRSSAIPNLVSELAVTNSPATAGKRLSIQMIVRDQNRRLVEDIVPDHAEMMHLIVVKLPDASYFLHVHPRMSRPGIFSFEFTPPEPGTYKFFGDILHSTGEGETVTTSLDVSPGTPAGDIIFGNPSDSHSFQPPIGDTPIGNRSWNVGDDLVMRWVEPPPAPIKKGEFIKMVFELAHADGRPVAQIEPYLGMAGHMLLMRHDAEVFSHLHPAGSVPGMMLMRTRTGEPLTEGEPRPPRPQMDMPVPQVLETSRAAFPFGFPEAGDYRTWVQMRYQGHVYTGVFDVHVD